MRTRVPVNIFFIVIDALRPDHLGCYGYHRDTSPVIDQIALEGILFENTIAQSSWTKPSIASLLSGTYPETHGVQEITHALGGLDHYLPVVLRQAGYVTGAIQTNPFLSQECGFGQGFDLYLELFENNPGIYKPTVTEAMTAVSDWLDGVGFRPFFLYLHLLDTHNPYEPPGEFQRFGKQEEDQYDAEINLIDYHIGLIRDILLKKGLYEKTVLIITADHGEEFDEHGGRYHAKHLYQEVLKVPLIITAPGIIPAWGTASSQVRSVDIAPTILEIAGLAPVEQYEGTSLVPLINGIPTPNLPAISQIGSNESPHGINLLALTAGEYKLIVNESRETRELYNLSDDPQEQVNLAAEEEATVCQLEAQVASLLEASADSFKQAKTKPKPRHRIMSFEDHILRQLRGLGYIE